MLASASASTSSSDNSVLASSSCHIDFSSSASRSAHTRIVFTVRLQIAISSYSLRSSSCSTELGYLITSLLFWSTRPATFAFPRHRPYQLVVSPRHNFPVSRLLLLQLLTHLSSLARLPLVHLLDLTPVCSQFVRLSAGEFTIFSASR